MNRAPLLIALACLFCPSLARAQDSQSQVSVSFTVVGWGDTAPNVSYRESGKAVNLEIHPFTRSKVYKYTGPSRMLLFVNQQDKPAGFVDFQPPGGRYTILLGGSDDRIVARGIDDDARNFPLGTARIFNLLDQPMQVRCNKKELINIPVKQHMIAKPREDKLLLAEAASKQGEEWKRIGDNFVHVPADAQTSIFFFRTDAKFFKSIDGTSAAVQMLVLRDSPNKETSDQDRGPGYTMMTKEEAARQDKEAIESQKQNTSNQR